MATKGFDLSQLAPKVSTSAVLGVTGGGTGVTTSTGTGNVVLSASPTLSGVTTIPDGTDAAPSLKFAAGGTQLGLYTISNDYIGVVSRGLPAVAIGGFDDSGQHGEVYIYGNSNTTYGGGVTCATSRGTRAIPTIVQNGDEIGYTQYGAYDGAAYRYTGYINCTVDGVPGSGDMPTALNFYTTPDGSTSYALRMKIDQAGNVGIGTSSPDFILDVLAPSNLAESRITATVETVSKYGYADTLYGINNPSAPTPQKDLFSVGAQGTYSNAGALTGNDFYVYDNVVNIKRMGIDSSGNVGIGMTPVAKLDVTGTIRGSTTIGVGGATPAASGAGITFPATQSASSDANTLDDYEEGTFTPTTVGTTIAGAGTYTAQTARYTKIGRMVHVAGFITTTAHTGTGNMRLGGLPFTSANITGINPVQMIDYGSLAVPANSIPALELLENTTTAAFISLTTAATGTAALAMDVGCALYFNLTYEAA
jgi:hypothetical protein